VSISEENILIEVQDEQGNKVRQFPYTKAENVLGLAALIKNIDNDKQLAALLLLSTNPYLVDEVTQKTYRLGIKDGELFCVEVDYGVQEILGQSDDPSDPDGSLSPTDSAAVRLLQQEVASMSKRISTYNYDEQNRGLVIRTSSTSGGGSSDPSDEDDGN